MCSCSCGCMVAEVTLSLFVPVCSSGAFLVGFVASLTLVDTPGLFVDREFFLNRYSSSSEFLERSLRSPRHTEIGLRRAPPPGRRSRGRVWTSEGAGRESWRHSSVLAAGGNEWAVRHAAAFARGSRELAGAQTSPGVAQMK